MGKQILRYAQDDKNGYSNLKYYSIASGEYSLEIFGCIYVSSVLYTTLGASNITPEGSLRMIVAVEALTGFMLIGWTISFAYLAMEQFWKLPHKRQKEAPAAPKIL